MGFNTAAIILNDQLRDLAKDPAAGAKIASAIAQHHDGVIPDLGVGLLSSAHADTVQIVAVGANTLQRLGYGHWRQTPEDLLRSLANQMGFRLVRRTLSGRAPKREDGQLRDEPLPPDQEERP